MHLLWRLQHGQVFTKHIPQVAVVMIGTNDLGASSCMGQGEDLILQAANGTADRYLIPCLATANSFDCSIHCPSLELGRHLFARV